MSREIPEPVRAVAGLAATVLDETRKLPGTLPSLPLRVIGLAMQATMKLQQGYAGLVARGDELFTGLRGEQEPGLATFDDEVETGQPTPAPAKTPPGFRDSAFDRATGPLPGDTLDESALEPLPGEPGADAAVTLADELAGAEEALDELAIDEMVDDRALASEAITPEPDALENALLEADAATATSDAPATTDEAGTPEETPAADTAAARSTDVAEALPVDVPGPDGQVDIARGVVTEEGIVAAVEEPAESPAGAQAAQQPAPPADAAAGPQADTTAGTTTGETGGAPVGEAAGAPGGESVTGAEAAVDEAAGSAPAAGEAEPAPAAGEATPASGAAAAPEGGRETAPEGGGAAAPAGEARAEDAAIREGADADAAGGEPAAPTDEPEGGSELAGSQAAGTAPVDGYDGWSIAQLRGRLRGYDRGTVEGLLAYEESTRAREPYVRMLRNRLERLDGTA